MLRSILVLAAFASFCESAAAQSVGQDREVFVTLLEENDDLPPASPGADQKYTQALRITVDANFAPIRLPWLDGIADCSDGPDPDPAAPCRSQSFWFGNQFYTPTDITLTELIPNDRPFGGWTYIGASVNTSADKWAHTTELTLGVTGRWSGSGAIQRRWHDVVSARDNPGWRNQVPERLGVIAAHTRRQVWTERKRASDDERWLEALKGSTARAGNLFAEVEGSVQVKIGKNLTRDWSALGVAPAAPARPMARREAAPEWDAPKSSLRKNWEYYAVGSAEAHAIGYNYFLEGSRAHTIDRRWFYGRFSAGVAARYKRVETLYRHVWVTPEFYQSAWHTYMSLRVRVLVG